MNLISIKVVIGVLSASLLGSNVFLDATKPDYVIDLSNSANMPNIVAVQVCAGLLNREASSPSVYTLLNEPYDSQWLSDIEGVSSPSLTSVDNFLETCLASTKVREGDLPLSSFNPDIVNRAIFVMIILFNKHFYRI